MHKLHAVRDMIQDMEAREYIVGKIVEAVENQGRSPAYHRNQLARLRREWPTLYYTVMELVNHESGRNHKAKG